MFGDRIAKHTESLLEKIPQRFSNVHRAGLMLFAGLLHVAAYDEYLSAPKQIAELKMAVKAAESDIATAAWFAKNTELKMLRGYREFDKSEWFSAIQQDLLEELSGDKGRAVPIARVLGNEEYFVEGVPISTFEKGTKHYDEIIAKLRSMRKSQEDPAQVTDEVLNAILAVQGEYDENQPSAITLFAGEGGNCQARAKAIAMLLDGLFPEYRESDWIKIEVYRGYVDSAGEEHLGHIRVVLDIPGEDHYSVMEGKEVYSSPRQEDNVTRVEAHDAFVRGSATAMGIVEGGVSDGYEPRRLGILYPDSPVRYLGSENGEMQWWPEVSSSTAQEEQEHYGLASGVDILDEAITDEQVERLVALKKENAELPHRFQEFLHAHEGEGVEMTESTVVTGTGRIGVTKVVILPLHVSPEIRSQTESFVAELRKTIPDAKFKLLYGITAVDQKIVPLSDPDSEYIFLIPPTPKLMAQYPTRSEMSRVIVKDVDAALQERGVDPAKFFISICDPVTSLEELRALNAFVAEADESGYHPHVQYVLDFPEQIQDIPISGYTSVHLKRPDAFVGKHLFAEQSLVRVAFLHGALPSIHAEKQIDIIFTADLSGHGSNPLILGQDTEFSLAAWNTIEFVGTAIVQEGWKISGPDNGQSDLRFKGAVSFDSRAFNEVEQAISLQLKSSELQHIDPHVFDGLHKEIQILALSEDPDSSSFYTDTDEIEKRIRAEVIFPPTVTMTVMGDWTHRYLKIIPKP